VERWEFDETVTVCFDDMLKRSIPNYRGMRRLVQQIAERYRRDDTDVVDLGCSRGEAMAQLVEQHGLRNRFVGVERAPAMLAAARARFAGRLYVELEDLDLQHGYPAVSASVTLAILTLQFVTTDRRWSLIRDIHESTTNGGALILVEKVRGTTKAMDQMLAELYRAHKLMAGYSAEAIAAKEQALEGILIPMTAATNEKMLFEAGFNHVECFWRSLNFAGWVAAR
jgi:tRNA (cmo5U34)-methyltransferase